MSDVKLKPCPFCGADRASLVNNEFTFYYVCNECTGVTGCCDSEDKARLEWNTRPVEAELAGMVHDLLTVTGVVLNDSPTEKLLEKRGYLKAAVGIHVHHALRLRELGYGDDSE